MIYYLFKIVLRILYEYDNNKVTILQYSDDFLHNLENKTINLWTEQYSVTS